MIASNERDTAGNPTPVYLYKRKQQDNWLPELEGLRAFFDERAANHTLPATLRLNAWTVYEDVPKAISFDMERAAAHNGNLRYDASLTRLRMVKQIIESL